eukprot:2452964-Pyramimonas_sp.AAC.1
MAPKSLRGIQDGRIHPKMDQDGFQDASGGSKTAPRRVQVTTEPPQKTHKRPTSFNHLVQITAACRLGFSLPIAFRGPKMAPR